MAYYKASKKLTLITEIYARSGSYADEENQVLMSGYEFVNLQGRYATQITSGKLEFFAKVNNIFDKHYFRTAYVTRDRDGDDVLTREDASLFVDPGRVYYAGVNYVF